MIEFKRLNHTMATLLLASSIPVAQAGGSPCTVELEKIALDYKVNGRTLVIRTVPTPEAFKEEHILFVPATEDSRLKDWLGAVQGVGILTIGESDLSFKQTGMINFIREGEKIRFEINGEQADGAGLKIGAQLQKLAKSIRRKS